jgi:hypothetical protein
MAKDWRCLIGRHDWRVVETAHRDKYSECGRCGKHDWVRALPRRVEKGKLPGPPPLPPM